MSAEAQTPAKCANATGIFPGSLLLFQVIGLVETIWALVITHLVITIPIIVWVMIGYFESVPLELEGAARVGGPTDPGRGVGQVCLSEKTPRATIRVDVR